MAAFLDICRFLPTAGGTTDWTYAATVQGYQSPAAAGASNGRLYKYRAESSELTQWEMGEGAYNAATGTFARTTILFNSAGTTVKVNFSAVPQVAIIALKEDLISIEEANGFTAAQQAQARSNIGAAAAPGTWTFTVLTAASGTYTPPAGCRAIHVTGRGGGGGGGAAPGGGGAAGGAQGGRFVSLITSLAASYSYAVGAGGAPSSTGGTTTFGSMSAIGGNAGNTTNPGSIGGSASGGNIENVRGAPGGNPMYAGNPYYGGPGGGEGGGAGATTALSAVAGQSNTGSGGGGAASSGGGGAPGGSGIIIIREYY